ncbi:MAG: DUF1667 domain-containing protein [Thermoplasmata archaeon]
MSQEVVCIMCPLGCRIKVQSDDGGIQNIKGFACENGKEYAEQEILCSTRTVMSVVRCRRGDFPTVSIKTSEPVDKDKIEDIMEAISKIEVDAPVRVGDKLLENVCKTGADIVATRNVEVQEHSSNHPSISS